MSSISEIAHVSNRTLFQLSFVSFKTITNDIWSVRYSDKVRSVYIEGTEIRGQFLKISCWRTTERPLDNTEEGRATNRRQYFQCHVFFLSNFSMNFINEKDFNGLVDFGMYLKEITASQRKCPQVAQTHDVHV